MENKLLLLDEKSVSEWHADLENITDIICENERIISLFQSLAECYDNIKSGNYSQRDVENFEITTNRIAKYIANVLSMDIYGVNFYKNKNQNDGGGYDPYYKTIHLNVNREQFADFLITILHESRHAYQFQKLIKSYSRKKYVDCLKDGLKNYSLPDENNSRSVYDYVDNALEQDANLFGITTAYAMVSKYLYNDDYLKKNKTIDYIDARAKSFVDEVEKVTMAKQAIESIISTSVKMGKTSALDIIFDDKMDKQEKKEKFNKMIEAIQTIIEKAGLQKDEAKKIYKDIIYQIFHADGIKEKIIAQINDPVADSLDKLDKLGETIGFGHQRNYGVFGERNGSTIEHIRYYYYQRAENGLKFAKENINKRWAKKLEYDKDDSLDVYNKFVEYAPYIAIFIRNSGDKYFYEDTNYSIYNNASKFVEENCDHQKCKQLVLEQVGPKKILEIMENWNNYYRMKNDSIVYAGVKFEMEELQHLLKDYTLFARANRFFKNTFSKSNNNS